MTDELVLGLDPGPLTVRLVVDDPWEASLILKENGTPIAWPAAPLLEFAGTELDVEATLGADDATSTADAEATWSLTEEQVNAIAAQGISEVRLSVDGETWWMGSVECRS